MCQQYKMKYIVKSNKILLVHHDPISYNEPNKNHLSKMTKEGHAEYEKEI